MMRAMTLTLPLASCCVKGRAGEKNMVDYTTKHDHSNIKEAVKSEPFTPEIVVRIAFISLFGTAECSFFC